MIGHLLTLVQFGYRLLFFMLISKMLLNKFTTFFAILLLTSSLSMKKSPRWRAEDAQDEERWRQTDLHHHQQQHKQQQKSVHGCSECSISAASLILYIHIAWPHRHWLHGTEGLLPLKVEIKYTLALQLTVFSANARYLCRIWLHQYKHCAR